MKVLWLCNIIMPDICSELSLPKNNTGGWMVSLSKAISQDNKIELAIAAPGNVDKVQKIIKDNIIYYIYPQKNFTLTRYKQEGSNEFEVIIKEFNPSLVHIFGTEFPYGLCFLENNTSNIPNVVSIQGMVSMISRYYLSNISNIDIIKNITFRDIIKNDNIFQAKKRYYKRGVNEVKILRNTKNIIGRTNWDFSETRIINPKINYYYCDEAIRDSFFKNKWDIEACEKNTIFVSQGMYPIKGLHILINAIGLLKHKYNNIKVYVAGVNKISGNKIKDKLKRDGYSNYIKKLIKKKNLDENIIFLGSLEEDEMARQMVKANVSVMPSSIENSPNSLIEAMVMGVPCIASYVGGIPDIIEDNVTGLLYRFEDYEVLAYHIDNIFSDNELSSKLSTAAYLSANRKYKKQNIVEDTYKIYESILKSEVF